LSYRGFEIADSDFCAVGGVVWGGIEKQDSSHHASEDEDAVSSDGVMGQWGNGADNSQVGG
jgi:hypothetical protein